MIHYKFTAKNIDWRQDIGASYRDNMALKYHFSPQDVYSTELWVLEKGVDLTIGFKESENVSMQIGEEKFFGVTKAYFCNDMVSHITTNDGKMHHFYDDRHYNTTPM
jgi:hypothetical protein